MAAVRNVISFFGLRKSYKIRMIEFAEKNKKNGGKFQKLRFITFEEKTIFRIENSFH